jgi:PAS domain S-box-containing protein
MTSMPKKPTYAELRQRVSELEQIGSERKRMKVRPVDADSNLSQIMQAMAIPAFAIDKEHFVTHWNKACEKMTGIPSIEIIGTKDAWKAFYQTKRPVLADLVVESSLENTVAEHYEEYSKSELIEDALEAQSFFPQIGGTGKWLYFTATPLKDSSEKLIGAIETFQDITERRRAEEHHRLVLEAIPDPVIVYDPQRVITYINEAFEGTYGWTKNELIGGIIEFVPPEEIEGTAEAWRRTLLGEKVFFETKRNTKDGRLLNIQLRTAILKDLLGNHFASIVIHRDVTVLKQAEKDRERLIGELRNALAEVKTLSGFLPICSSCKRIRDDKGYWNQIEAYIRDHSEAEFSHSVCPQCAKKLYPDLEIDDD